MLDEFQDAAFELARSTEHRIFRFGHRKVVAETGLDQFESANEIGKLEEPILFRLDGLCKLDFETRLCNEIPMQKVGDGGLPAVVVNLDAVELSEIVAVAVDEVGKQCSEFLHNLVGRVAELLVNDQTVKFEIGLAGKCHHCSEDAITELPVKDGVNLLLTDERPSVKADVVEVHGAERGIKSAHGFVYLGTLIMEDKRYDVKARRDVGALETPRFVNEYAQCSFFHVLKIISDEDYSPSLKAKNFLRFSKIPTFRLRSAILYHIQSAKRNGEFCG